MSKTLELDLGINSESIGFEVALEVLGQSRQPFMNAIHEERQKPAPSEAFICYCEMRLKAIDALQDSLKLNDKDTIRRILTKDPVFLTSCDSAEREHTNGQP
mgnify:CR=1 FL=1